MNDYALVIGIEGYVPFPDETNSILAPLKGARKDAEAFADWLCGTCGFDRNGPNLWLLLSNDDPANALPTRQKIDEAFQALIATATAAAQMGTPPRRLYVYFVGHGALPEANPQEIVGLLLASAGKNPSECLSGTHYRNALNRGPLFPEQLFFFDCCRNVDALFYPQSAPFGVPVGDAPCQYIYYGAKRETKSNRRPVYREGEDRGFFTAALLEGLNGEAAVAESDGAGGWRYRVTTESLSGYLFDRVPALALSLGRKQSPGYWRDEATPTQLVIVDDVRAPRVVELQTDRAVIALNTYVGQYEGGKNWPVNEGRAQVNLSAGDYIVEAADAKFRPSQPVLLPLQDDGQTVVQLGGFVWA